MTNRCSPWQCELSHIGSNERLFDRPNMGHPSYSPDLAPNDFFLFQHIKQKMRGQRFSSPEDAVGAFKKTCFGGVSIGVEKVLGQVVWAHAQKCINHAGEYFEKQYRGRWKNATNFRLLSFLNRLVDCWQIYSSNIRLYCLQACKSILVANV